MTELSNFNKLLKQIINENDTKDDIYRNVAALVDIHIVDLYNNIAQFMEEMGKKQREENE